MLGAGAQRARHDAPPRAGDRAAARRHRRPALFARCSSASDDDARSRPSGHRRARAQAPTSTRASSSILGRAPNLVELGIFSVMWSEHCSYKSSKQHLAQLPDRGALGALRPGRERGRGRHRRRHGRRLQDGEPQPPELHRALPGCGHRASAAFSATSSPWARGRWRSSTRCASATRRTRRPGIWSAAWSPASAATATASACPRSAASAPSTAPTTAISWSTPSASACRRRPDLLWYGLRRREPRRLRRGQDRARRHPRRHHGLGRVQTRPRPSVRRCRWATRSPRSC